MAQDRIVCESPLFTTYEQADLPFNNGSYWNQEKFPPFNEIRIGDEEVFVDYT